jgi:hypothetical protein
MTGDYTCAECGRDMIRLTGPDMSNLCPACLMLPGWFRNPELRKHIDPDHDGRELAERAPGAPPAPR